MADDAPGFAGGFSAPKHALLQAFREPERGLEPLTYRLEGDASVSLKTPVRLQNYWFLVGAQIVVFGWFRLNCAPLRPMGTAVGLNGRGPRESCSVPVRPNVGCLCARLVAVGAAAR